VLFKMISLAYVE